MQVERQLSELEHEIRLAAAYAPNQYPSWSRRNRETHMADLERLWRTIRPQLERDADTAAWVELTLHKMIVAFSNAEQNQQGGLQAAQALLRAHLRALR
jgi:hypothetical protein